MIRNDLGLSETDIRSDSAVTRALRVNSRVRRAWLKGEPSFAMLERYQILHIGVGCMPAPFEIVRTKLKGSYFLSCSAGVGEVVIDGRAKRCAAGQAFLLQPGTRHEFRSLPKQAWEISWVRFQEQTGHPPIATANSPILAEYDPHPLRLAIEGLYHEATHNRQLADMESWLELAFRYVLRFTEPRQMDERIWRLWEQVESELAYPWSNAELARKVHLGEKQLERLCRRELGRTPKQHLIWLRMRKAASLLADESRKVAQVAAEVGYDNPFVFSTTFKRCIGWSPSEHSRRLRAPKPRHN